MRSPASGDAGSAIVEAVAVGVLLLLPMLQLVVVVSRVQAAAFAVDAGAASAARAAADPAAGPGVAQAAVALALADQGLDGGPPAQVSVTCDDAACTTPGARVGVEVRYDVAVPTLPLLGGALPVRVPLEARSTALVDRFVPAAGTP